MQCEIAAFRPKRLGSPGTTSQAELDWIKAKALPG